MRERNISSLASVKMHFTIRGKSANLEPDAQ